ncbi:MAG TPA: cation diffusion facilitator family transporter [Dokdonella sp.]|nr:cation diffusion facilitator family transporter [Dokdonella sp.]
MAGKGNSIRAIFFALGANFAIFVAKLVAALMTGSGAMLAEAVHSLADCGNQVLLLFGIRQAKKPPSPDYPLGYGKAVYFWSFLVALMLFSVGGMFSIYEGLHKLGSDEPLKSPWIAVGVLVFSIIVEGISMRACLVEVNKARGARSLWQWFRSTRQVELVVIFGEDLAALLGLTFALLAVSVAMATGNPVWDAVGTLAIGALLIIVAVFISIEVKAMLIGQSVEPETRDQMREFLEQRPEVERVYNLLTMQLGSDVMVSVKAKMRGEDSAAGMIAQINAVERELKRRFPEVRFSFFEPDFEDGNAQDRIA